MVDHSILVDTAAFYGHRARDNHKYSEPRETLNGAVRRLGLPAKSTVTELRNSDQFIVVRSEGIAGEPELVRHPLDVVESGVAAGVEALNARGMFEGHTCLIAVPRGSLTGAFTWIYEVVRRCGWSVLPLGGSTDGHDISQLCNAYEVDVLVITADAIESVFAPDLVGQFDSVTTLLHVFGPPSQRALETLATHFPHLEVHPFIYLSNLTGPIGRPVPGQDDTSFDVLGNILVEVEAEDGEITLNGSGAILVSVLGMEEPTLIRRKTNDHGELSTGAEGQQVVRLQRRVPQ